MKVITIDSGYTRPQMTAVYLLQAGSELALIETATTPQIGRIFNALQQHGLNTKQIRYIIPTHVHLDHAGAAGALLQHCPNATVLCHPRAQRHLIDPSKLIAGATAVYGETALQQLYGDILPIEAQRTQVMEDESSIDLGPETLRFLDTPGHARHHFCVHVEALQGLFTGDCCGLAYPELSVNNKPMVFPTTTPVQFDPGAMIKTLNRLYDCQPSELFLTHYGSIRATEAVRQQLLGDIEAFVTLTDNADTQNDLLLQLNAYLMNRVQNHQCPASNAQIQSLMKMDIDLNAQGLWHWKTTSG